MSIIKINEEVLTLIRKTVSTAKTFGIEDIIIEENMVRGLHPDRVSVLLHTENIPLLPFNAIAINRLSVFSNRIDLANTQENMIVEVTTDNDTNASSLTFKAGRLKINYRCANPSTVKAPKKLKDIFIRRITISNEAKDMLIKAYNAMKTEYIAFVNDEQGVRFEMFDLNNDVCSFQFSDNVVMLEDGYNETFTIRYPVKMLLALFKNNTETTFEIGKEGVLKMNYNDLNMLILPKV